jgi:CMP-N-acetylneuraminic acid synthetase
MSAVQPGRTLCLIPAKAGSTRLPRKNLMKIGGRTLIEWAVLRARESGLCNRIFVSSEDAEVLAEAGRLGLETPFLRPPELARDPAGVVEVALHALDEWEKRGEVFDTLIILLPTSPFCSAEDVRAAMAQYLQAGTGFLMSVSRPAQSPLTAQILRDGQLSPLHPEWLFRSGAKATAEVPVIVNSNGAVTILDVVRFRAAKEYYVYPLAAYEMPRERSVDIDTEEDFLYARFLARTRFGLDEDLGDQG